MATTDGLAGKRAIVTGGATGIGRAIAAALAARGVRVAIGDVDLAAARETARRIDTDVLAVALDVRLRDSVTAAFETVAERFGGYDILIANAGISTMNRAVDLGDAEWEDTFAVNTKGVFLTNQVALRHFLARRIPGVIVNTASLAAKAGAPLLAHYSASKFAVLGWTQAVAHEMAPHGIRINAVCPGYVRTGMQTREVGWEADLRGVDRDAVVADYVAATPLGRLEEPADVAGVVVFLASDAAAFITGEAINVNGGVRMD